MTVEEADQLMDVLETFYPMAYAKRTDEERLKNSDLWATMFVHDDVRLVLAAVKLFIAEDEKGFPPMPGQIRAKMRLIASHGELTAAEAWACVKKATPRVGRPGGAAEEFRKLPPIAQKLVGSPAQLRKWANMDSDTLDSVVASTFRKDYQAALEKERAFASLSPDVRRLVCGETGSPSALEADNPPWVEGGVSYGE